LVEKTVVDLVLTMVEKMVGWTADQMVCWSVVWKVDYLVERKVGSTAEKLAGKWVGGKAAW
jgi:hypothetical protein